MLLFNFLEPAATIIAQTIPIFRVLFVRVRRGTQPSKTPGIHTYRPASDVELVPSKSDPFRSPVWDGASSNSHDESDQRLSENERLNDLKDRGIVRPVNDYIN